jgi:hypothetical protein
MLSKDVILASFFADLASKNFELLGECLEILKSHPCVFCVLFFYSDAPVVGVILQRWRNGGDRLQWRLSLVLADGDNPK